MSGASCYSARRWRYRVVVRCFFKEKSMSSELGRSMSIHRGTFWAGGYLWYVGAVCLVGGFIAMGKGVMSSEVGATGQGLAAGLGTILLGLGVLAVPMLRWKQSLEIFEGGFVWTRLTGVVTVRRDEIEKVEHITHRSAQGEKVELIVFLTNGKSRSIVGIEQPGQAANLLSGPAPAAASATSGGWKPPTQRTDAPAGGWTPPGGMS
jgi:hypothetical protein